MEEIKETGGAEIGMGRATWPFARLTVNRDKLQLNASIIGNLLFRPSDIVSIEPYSVMFSKGIRIVHRVNNYSNNVIFLTLGDPVLLIRKIGQTGFLNNTSPLSPENEALILAAQSTSGFPVRTPAAIIIAIIWNVLILGDIVNGFRKTGYPAMPAVGIQYALIFMILLSLLLLVYKPIRPLILKEGRSVADIRTFLFFLIFIAAFMLFIILVTKK
jgi:hypothetical protein